MFDFLRHLFGEPADAVPTASEPPPGLEQVTADASRCVQCGLCGFNCPVGINVRAYARRGDNVTDPRCITCGTCITVCPRGTLRWGKPILIREDGQLLVDPEGLPGQMGFERGLP